MKRLFAMKGKYVPIDGEIAPKLEKTIEHTHGCKYQSFGSEKMAKRSAPKGECLRTCATFNTVTTLPLSQNYHHHYHYHHHHYHHYHH